MRYQSGLHYYDPSGENLAFVMTIDGNESLFTKRQVDGAEQACVLYVSLLGYPLYFVQFSKWNLCSNQFSMNCSVTVQDAEVALKIWGPNTSLHKKGRLGRCP